LVHCSDGTDVTSIIISLAKLLMDPSYRSLQGFCRLLKEDWIDGGFRFITRNRSCTVGKAPLSSLSDTLAEKLSNTIDSMTLASSETATSTTTASPVFLLFLECVHQIWSQFTTEFEWNLEFLSFIYLHSVASPFGMENYGKLTSSLIILLLLLLLAIVSFAHQ
jgi:hypothetical protein